MDLNRKISYWLTAWGSWQRAVSEIMEPDNYKAFEIAIQTVLEHMQIYRPIPFEDDYCATEVNWCVISQAEYDKCVVIRHAGISAGVLPQIGCKLHGANDLDCLQDINLSKSDFTGIDSNHGYIGRK